MSIKVKVAQLVAGQLPAFVRDEYPGFVTFLEAYYRFLEQESQPQALLNSAPDWIDVDSTLDEFVTKMRAQYASDISEQALIANRTLIKQVDQYYSTKGSEQATELFFRMMFNDLVKVQYPGQFILRASDGRWEKRRTIKIDTEDYSADPFDLVSKRVILRFFRYVPQVGVRPLEIAAEVSSVTGTNDPYIFTLDVSADAEQIQTAIDLEEIFGLTRLGYFFSSYCDDTYVLAPTAGDIDQKIRIVYNDIEYGALTRQLLSYNITTPGAKFRIGETFIIDEQGAGGAYFAQDYVVDLVGKDMYAGNNIDNRAILRVTANDGAPEVGYLGALKILASGYRFQTSTFSTSIAPPRTGGLPANIDFYTGFVKTYPGKFRSPAGFLSDICKIEDNKKIQQYAYVIQTHIPTDQWYEQYKNSAHPAGTRVFSDLILDGAVENVAGSAPFLVAFDSLRRFDVPLGVTEVGGFTFVPTDGTFPVIGTTDGATTVNPTTEYWAEQSVDTGYSDVDVSVTLGEVRTGGLASAGYFNDIWISPRFVDDSNTRQQAVYFETWPDSASPTGWWGVISVYDADALLGTNRSDPDLDAIKVAIPPLHAGSVIRVTAQGPIIRAYVDGAEVASRTEVRFMRVTKQSFGHYLAGLTPTTAIHFRDFTVLSAPSDLVQFSDVVS
jgi:hypothetical protein